MTLREYLESRISELKAEYEAYQFRSDKLYGKGLKNRIDDLENQLFNIDY